VNGTSNLTLNITKSATNGIANNNMDIQKHTIDGPIQSKHKKINQSFFAFRRYEDASLRYTGIESHEGLTHYGLYDTVVGRE
jgi:hypothetical protein